MDNRRTSPLTLKKRNDWKQRARAEIDVHAVSRVYRFSFRPRGSLDMTVSNPSIASVVSEDIRRWRQNVSHAMGAPVTFLAVPEFGGEGGRIHYHVLVHGDVPSRLVRKAWKQGQTHVKNIKSDRMASYVTKYIGKDLGAASSGMRVRASHGYGRSAQRKLAADLLQTEAVREVLKVFPLAEPMAPAGPYFRKVVPAAEWSRVQAEEICNRPLPVDFDEIKKELGTAVWEPAAAVYGWREEMRRLRGRWANTHYGT